MSITVMKPGQHVKFLIGAGGSKCYYFPPFDLSAIDLKGSKGPWARFAIIEVPDVDTDTHRHAGAVFTYIISGSGYFKTDDGNIPVEQGDMIHTPRVKHTCRSPTRARS